MSTCGENQVEASGDDSCIVAEADEGESVWNVRTIFATRKAAHVASEMRSGLLILGSSLSQHGSKEEAMAMDWSCNF